MSEDKLGRLVAIRKTGMEPFRSRNEDVDFDVLSFWQWSVSDLLSNATRGRLAEYIIARALGLGAEDVRNEWAPYDLETKSGIKIEVKSAAYLQSWDQKRLSVISFEVPKTRGWDPDTGIMETEAKRQADIYIFALLNHVDKQTVDPLNLDQWRFYVLPTEILNKRTRSQHSITLRSLQNLCSAVPYAELGQVVEKCE
ncbi:MAG: hypothetical protein HY776_03090 [Actinobacteria bacterium]|nr:hypothetical protein [Actinomycetota bacterium]